MAKQMNDDSAWDCIKKTSIWTQSAIINLHQHTYSFSQRRILAFKLVDLQAKVQHTLGKVDGSTLGYSQAFDVVQAVIKKCGTGQPDAIEYLRKTWAAFENQGWQLKSPSINFLKKTIEGTVSIPYFAVYGFLGKCYHISLSP